MENNNQYPFLQASGSYLKEKRMLKFSSKSCSCTWREHESLKDWAGKWSVALILTFLTGLVLSQSSSLSEGVIVTQSCQTLCNPMDCSPPGSSVHGILQASILEWVVISFSNNIFYKLFIHHQSSFPKISSDEKKNSASRSNPGTHITLTCYMSLSPLIWNNPSICLCLLRPWFFLTNKDLLYSTGNSA